MGTAPTNPGGERALRLRKQPQMRKGLTAPQDMNDAWNIKLQTIRTLLNRSDPLMQSLKVKSDSLEPSTGNRDNMSITISENRSDLFNQRLGNDKIGITTYPTINPGAVQQPLTHFFQTPSVSNMMETFVSFSLHCPKMEARDNPALADSIAMGTPTQVLQDATEANHRRLAPPTVLAQTGTVACPGKTRADGAEGPIKGQVACVTKEESTLEVHGRAPFDEPVVTCRRLEVAEETGIILLGRAATVDHMAPHCFGPQHGGCQASFEASTHRQTSNAPGTTSDILQRVPFSV